MLAHEIAHVRGRDFVTSVGAHASLALHFYHPLVHWLVRRLRLEMELAADATAARVVGNPGYLQTLANLALRQSDRPLGRPARTFLPTRGTFLRRIEMLRDNRSSPRTPLAGTKLLAVGLLAATGLVAAGLRGAPGGGLAGTLTPAAAAALPTTPPADGNQPAAVEWVPADATGLLVVRPKELLAKPEMAELVKALQLPFVTMFDAQDGKVEQLTIANVPLKQRVVPSTLPPSPSEFVVVRFAESTKWTKPLTPNATPAESDFLGYRLHVEMPYAWFQPDDRTLVMASEAVLKLAIASGRQSKSSLLAHESWRALAGNTVVIAVNTDMWRPWIEQLLDAEPWLRPYAPIWTNTSAVFVGASMGKQIQFTGFVHCHGASDVQTVRDTLSAALTLAKNTSGQYRSRAAGAPANERALLTGLADLADRLLDSARLETAPNHVIRLAAATGVTPETLRLLGAASVQASAAGAPRAVAAKNMKQLMLAMHNYHDVHKRFPPAIVMGKDGNGGPAHSWRVELLPFLDAQKLYEAYHFDEPWDSEDNKKVLAQMPAVFRSPADPPDSTNASYFGLVGPGTVFSKPGGVALSEILDGSSNTIALVEARRDVPWTKPEDIVYSPDKPLPQFGSVELNKGFHAATCDGVVRFIARSIDDKIFRALVTIAGGVAF